MSTNPDLPSWVKAKQLVTAFETEQAAGLSEFAAHVRTVWDPRWQKTIFARDPLHENWVDAVFLKKANEPDYSDYLAWLIENSESGLLAFHLFNRTPAPLFKKYIPEHLAFPRPTFRQQFVAREERDYTDEADGWYQSDITIRWRNTGHTTQIEIKTGDMNFAKTPHHVEQTRKNHLSEKDHWDHFILILDTQAPEWKKVIAQHMNPDVTIHMLLWSDVAIALRKVLTASTSLRERQQWLWAAYALLGSIEQDLLKLPAISTKQRGAFHDFSLGKFILKESLHGAE